MADPERVESGSADLDTLLGGGLEKRVITQIYGEPGCGKSTLCLISAISILRGDRCVIYIDTEGFSIERFRQIAGEDAEALSRSLFLFEPVDFSRQGYMIGESEAILKTRDVGLIVLDSATALYRPESSAGGEAQRRLGHQLLRLLGYAKRFDIPVLVTNQVYMDINNDTLTGLGGTTLRHLSKVILRIERRNGFRSAVLEKHRSMPEGTNFSFEITGDGIRAL